MKPKTPKARGDHSRRPSPGEKTPGNEQDITVVGIDVDLLVAFLGSIHKVLAGGEDPSVERDTLTAMARYAQRQALKLKQRR